MSGWTVLRGECAPAMASMDAASVDAVVCDPPYGLEFMGKAWDRHASPLAFEAWCEGWAREAYRVLKPGGHLLAFGGTRTYHRLAAGIEDAGFEIRDTMMWLYGSGFPKSHNVSIAIDKRAGAEPTVIGPHPTNSCPGGEWCQCDTDGRAFSPTRHAAATAPATEDAAKWAGWGTALKPALEPIVVARKPLDGTVVANVLKHGTGALNIDGTRLGMSDADRALYVQGSTAWHRRDVRHDEGRKIADVYGTYGMTEPTEAHAGGRWPANVILSHNPDCEVVGTRELPGDPRDTGDGTRPGGFANVGADGGCATPNAPVYGPERVEAYACSPGCPVAALDAQAPAVGGGFGTRGPNTDDRPTKWGFHGYGQHVGYGDGAGGASRFFYCPKSSTAERNAGLEHRDARRSMEELPDLPWATDKNPYLMGGANERRNVHPTVKPIELMRWLVRLVTPPDGLVLDPFLGSGTTGIAAVLERMRFVGIEREDEYADIAEARIGWWERNGMGLDVDQALAGNAKRTKVADTGQSSIFDFEDAA